MNGRRHTLRRLVGVWVFCELLGGLPHPLWAQASLLPTVQEVFAALPYRPLSPADIGAALNTVAARHFIDGYGLHRKTAGHRCPQPRGVEIACDLLVHGPTGSVFDVLIDGDGLAVPTWHLVGPIDTMANFVTPTLVDVPTPRPSPPVDGDLEALVSVLAEHDAAIRADIHRLEEQVVALSASLTQHRKELQRAKGVFRRWIVERILPIVGAAFGGWLLT